MHSPFGPRSPVENRHFYEKIWAGLLFIYYKTKMKIETKFFSLLIQELIHYEQPLILRLNLCSSQALFTTKNVLVLFSSLLKNNFDEIS